MALFGLNKKGKSKKETPTQVIKSESKAGLTLASASSNFLKRPMVTEKAMNLAHKSQYIFEVSAPSTKSEIKKEVEKTFGVKVEKVNMANIKARPAMFRNRTSYHSGYKKAMVKLVPGHKIDIYPQ